MTLIHLLNERNQPYNIIIRDRTIYVIPRQVETNLKGDFGPAMLELFGVFIIKSVEKWDAYNEEATPLALIKEMKENVGLGDEEFESIKIEVIKRFKA